MVSRKRSGEDELRPLLEQLRSPDRKLREGTAEEAAHYPESTVVDAQPGEDRRFAGNTVPEETIVLVGID
jgi:hypothetical protein